MHIELLKESQTRSLLHRFEKASETSFDPRERNGSLPCAQYTYLIGFDGEQTRTQA